MKRHYYRLGGESLKALNKLVEYDTLLNDFRHTALRAKLAGLMGGKGPEDDPAILQSTLSLHFSSAQVKAYQDALGFNSPAVKVFSYAGGTVRRAYNVFPKLAMKPGTSKATFGFGDLFMDQTGERVAICTVEEDYKGAHFVPPGAVKLTEDEFAAYDAEQDGFEYYRTYDEGTAIPGDFDPAAHTLHAVDYEQLSNLTHIFLVQGEANRRRIEDSAKFKGWHMPYQDYRDKLMPPLLQSLTPHARKLNSQIETLADGTPAVSFRLAVDDWNAVKDDLARALELRAFIALPMDGCEVRLAPKTDTAVGAAIAQALATVPPWPKHTVSFGFEERPPLKNHVKFDATMTGFPYMKIERFDGGDVKVLAFRLPPNIKKVDPPRGCSMLDPDDYIALGGDANDRPTHAFRIGGAAYDALAAYDREMDGYVTATAAFRKRIGDMARAIVPDFDFDEYGLREYKSSQPRPLQVTMKADAFAALKAVLEDHFGVHVSGGHGHRRDRVKATLMPRRDTENGLAMARALDAVPYEPSWPRALERHFGFLSCNGYDQMNVMQLGNMGLNAVVYRLPAYISGVEPPQDCIALTTEEYAQILLDEFDLAGARVPPPRPDHLRHLPGLGAERMKRVEDMRKSRLADGLALHQRSEFSWFQIR